MSSLEQDYTYTCFEMGKSALVSYLPINISVKYCLLFLLIFIFYILGLNFIQFLRALNSISFFFPNSFFFFFLINKRCCLWWLLNKEGAVFSCNLYTPESGTWHMSGYDKWCRVPVISPGMPLRCPRPWSEMLLLN